MKSSKASLLPFATATVMLLLNYPWLSLYSSNKLVAGMPPLFIYLFVLWLGFIITVWLLIRSDNDNQDNDHA
jgi:hypothetical protein